MKKTLKTMVAATVMVSLVGCSSMSNQDVGVLTGGAIGGAVGSLFGGGSGKILAAVGGTLIGAMIGGAIGKNMDQVDQMRAQQAIQNNQAASWQNPKNGNQYTVTPTNSYYNNGMPCRDFTTKAIIGGQPQTVYGHACRMADGSWQMQNN